MRDAGRPEVVGPHGRLGVAWAVVTVAATAAGALWLALWLGAAAGLAGAQIVRARGGRSPARSAGGGRPPPPPLNPVMVIAGVGAACVTLAGAAGPLAVAVAAGVVPVVAVGSVLVTRSAGTRTFTEPLLVSGAAVMVGLGGAAPVLLRAGTGLVPVLVLFAYAMAYDAGTYVVGSGAASAWEGPAAGIAATGTVTLTVAAVLAPPFDGISPWLLGVLAAVLAPLGPIIASAFPGTGGDRKVRMPALLRLDSLLVLGPLWGLAAVLLLN